MNFLFLCHSLNIGGIETYILRFAKWMKQKHHGHDLHVICKSGKFGSYEADFREAGVKLHATPLGYINPLQYFRFYGFLRGSHFDAICDFSGDFGAFTVSCAHAAKIPRRMIFYRNARNAYKETSLKKSYHFLLNRIVRVFSTKILSNSREALGFYYPDFPVDQDPRFQVILNGIPLPGNLLLEEKERIHREIGMSKNHKMILHVGSGRWEKNHKLILSVARMCQENGLNAYFCLVGPDVKENYEETAKKAHLNNIYFLGIRQDVGKLLQAADLFIFPSLSEGQPNALLEAMVAGLPFIASDIEPIREALPANWGDKWLFDPNNPEQAFRILKSQLNNTSDNFLILKDLRSWSRNKFNEDKCFDHFFSLLTLT